MDAVETIQAAIDKLEGLRKATSTYEVQGEWLVDYVGHHTCAGGTAESNGMHERGCGYEPLTNDPIIVTLHRTIDAQLRTLRDVYEARLIEQKWSTLVYTENAVLLAHAILGGDS